MSRDKPEDGVQRRDRRRKVRGTSGYLGDMTVFSRSSSRARAGCQWQRCVSQRGPQRLKTRSAMMKRSGSASTPTRGIVRSVEGIRDETCVSHFPPLVLIIIPYCLALHGLLAWCRSPIVFKISLLRSSVMVYAALCARPSTWPTGFPASSNGPAAELSNFFFWLTEDALSVSTPTFPRSPIAFSPDVA